MKFDAIFKEPVSAQNVCVDFIIDESVPVPVGHYSITVTPAVLNKWLNPIWYMDDSGFTQRPIADVEADIAEAALNDSDEKLRIEGIETAKTTSMYAGLSIEEIVTMISTQLSAAEDYEQFKAVVSQCLIEAAPFLAS